MSTVKLYDQDSYQKSFEASVVACTPTDDGFSVILDQTVFFPEEGGQTPDHGTLSFDNTIANVVDVQIDDNGIISHFCDHEIPIHTTVTGKINWAHRYSNMQQHTGEHIFSGVVHDALGYENVGFHLSDHVVTMDYDGPLTDEQIKTFETMTNEWIHKNVPVSACYPDEETLSTLSYRSKDGIRGAVRIVTIEGCDVCACCAPHVARTGEVGMLKVLESKPYKGGIRLSILCGMRALNDYRSKQDTLTLLSRLLSKPADELYERITSLFAERGDLKQQLYLAKKEQLDLMIETVPDDEINVCLFIAGADMNLVRKSVNTLMEKHTGFCLIANGTDESGYTFILGSSEAKANDAAALIRAKLGGKCGGSPQMIQGSINATAEDIIRIFR